MPSQSKRRLQPSPLWPQSRPFHKPSDPSVKAQCLQMHYSYSSLWKFGIDNSWQLGCRNSFNHLQQFIRYISKSNWTVRCSQLPPFQRVWSGPTLPLRTVASPHLPPPGRTGMARTSQRSTRQRCTFATVCFSQREHTATSQPWQFSGQIISQSVWMRLVSQRFRQWTTKTKMLNAQELDYLAQSPQLKDWRISTSAGIRLGWAVSAADVPRDDCTTSGHHSLRGHSVRLNIWKSKVWFSMGHWHGVNVNR